MKETGNQGSPFHLITAENERQRWTDVDRQRVIRLFKETGVVVFRGFKSDLQDFQAITDHYCNGYMFNPAEGREAVAPEHKIQTVNLSNAPFPLHAERSQTPFRADICWFHCRKAPGRGGETTFCDGALMVSRLSKNLRDYLQSRGLRYRTRNVPVNTMLNFLNIDNPEELNVVLAKRSLDHIYRYEDGRVSQDYQVPMLHKTRYGDGLAFANFLFFSRYMHQSNVFPTYEDESPIPDDLCNGLAHIAEQCTTEHQWQIGDLLMIDNTRVMHGRRAILDWKEREIWTRFGYANF